MKLMHNFKVGDKVRLKKDSPLSYTFFNKYGRKDYYTLTGLGEDRYLRFDNESSGLMSRNFELYVDEREEIGKAMDLFERYDLYRSLNGQYRVCPKNQGRMCGWSYRKYVLNFLFPSEKQTKLNELQKQIADLQKTANELEKEINE